MKLFPQRHVTRFAIAVAALCALACARADAQTRTTPAGATQSGLERALLDEINLARTQPAQYAALVEQWRPYFSGKKLQEPGRGIIITEEGVQALEDAVRFLRVTRPATPLNLSQGLCSGSRLLVSEQTKSGSTGHQGADGAYCEQRAARYGTWKEPIGENLSYGEDTARERVIALLIDDGVPSRGHRKRILDPSYKVAGIACGTHQLGTMCVITFAGGFTERAGAAVTSGPGAQTQPASVKRF